jgi:hypothetical protein
MIRRAIEEDLRLIWEYVQNAHAVSAMEEAVLSKVEVVRTIRALIQSKMGLVVLYKETELAPPSGILVAAATKLWFSHRRAASTLIFQYQNTEGAKELLSEFTSWANGIDAVNLMHVTRASAYESITDFPSICKDAGYQSIGEQFVVVRN